MITREQVRHNLSGPIASLSTVFNRDGSIDYDGLRSLIDADILGGTKTILLTWGDSLFSLLTDDEIAEVTKVVVEHTGTRAMVVAADGTWWTGKTVEFAKYVRGLGADVLMVKPPVWAGSCTVDTLVDHYATVAEHIPVMLVTNVFESNTELGLRTIERVCEEVDNVVAIKDDISGEFACKMTSIAHDKLAVFDGGGKAPYLKIVHYGAVGFMSTLIMAVPQHTASYWSAIERGDWEIAARIISNHDEPFRDYIFNLPGGADSGVHGMLELYGIAQRWRRNPYYNMNDEEMEQYQDFFKSRGWL